MHDNQSTKFSYYKMWPTLFFQICMSRRIFTIEQSQALRYRQFQLVIQVGMVLSSKLEKNSMIYVWLAQYYALRQEVVSIKCISARYLEQLIQFGTLHSVSKGWIHHNRYGYINSYSLRKLIISIFLGSWFAKIVLAKLLCMHIIYCIQITND